ncbi:hypothetical protein HQ533_01390 [Candidatus Woesearchaeota archaeon]|nr:hypothetical protein [Candidatus Woesearchaeota archaeon]
MKTKGQGATHNTLFNIIVGVVVLLVLLPISTRLYAGITNSVRDTDCYSTVLTRSFETFEYGFLAHKSDIEVFCPSYKIVFNDEDYTSQRGEEKTKIKKYPDKEITEELVNKVVAEEMTQCWAKFGRDKLDAFYIPRGWKYWAWDWDPIFSNEDKVTGCRTCAIISFNLANYQIFSGLKDYMKDRDISGKLAGESGAKKMYDYIAKHESACADDYLGGENCWEEFAKHNDIAFINTDLTLESNPVLGNQKNYLVVFVRQGVKKGGTLNTYLMDIDTKNALCAKDTLPFTANKILV